MYLISAGVLALIKSTLDGLKVSLVCSHTAFIRAADGMRMKAWMKRIKGGQIKAEELKMERNG